MNPINPITQSVQSQIDERNKQNKDNPIKVFNPNGGKDSQPQEPTPEPENKINDFVAKNEAYEGEAKEHTQPYVTEAEHDISPLAQNYKPTGIAYFDNKMAQGKGFNFIDAFIAKNILHIDLMAHINLNANVKNDTRLRNMTTFYKDIQKAQEAFIALNDSFHSNLKSIDGFAGGIANFAHNTLGFDRDQEAKEAMVKADIAKNKTAEILKTTNTSGAKAQEEAEKNINGNFSHSYNKRDGNLQMQEFAINKVKNNLHIAQSMGDTKTAQALAHNLAQFEYMYELNKQALQNSKNRAKFSKGELDKKGDLYKTWYNIRNNIVNFAPEDSPSGNANAQSE